MRKDVSKIISARKGDLIRAEIKLTKDMTVGRVGIWCSAGGAEFSPYVPERSIIADLGTPNMVKPMFLRIQKPAAMGTIEFTADYDMKVKLVQEVSALESNLVKTKVRRYGNIAIKIRRYLGNCKRRLRGLYATQIHMDRTNSSV